MLLFEMLAAAEPLKPIMVQVGDAPAKTVSFGHVLLSAAGFTLLLVIGAALVGLVLGGLFIAIHKLRPGNRFNGQRQPEPRLDLRSIRSGKS
ncbi:MAG TPA: hypothetical protein VIC33_15665 [Vicinamibacterales bacterium]